jgi:hypothetical protein
MRQWKRLAMETPELHDAKHGNVVRRGNWFNELRRFPAFYADAAGYVKYLTEADYHGDTSLEFRPRGEASRRGPIVGIRIGNVRTELRSHPDYTPIDRRRLSRDLRQWLTRSGETSSSRLSARIT